MQIDSEIWAEWNMGFACGYTCAQLIGFSEVRHIKPVRGTNIEFVIPLHSVVIDGFFHSGKELGGLVFGTVCLGIVQQLTKVNLIKFEIDHDVVVMAIYMDAPHLVEMKKGYERMRSNVITGITNPNTHTTE